MPTCTPLFVDKLAMTIAMDDEGTRDRISHWLLSDDTHFHGFEVTRTRGGRFYSLSKKIIFNADRKGTVLVEYESRRSIPRSTNASAVVDAEAELDLDFRAHSDGRRPLRIEFNPATLREVPEHYETFQRIMREWFGNALSSEMYSANITRIDLATDVRNLNINRIIACRNDSTVISTTYGRDGSIGTHYLGGKNSDVRFVIYDKRAQLRGRVIANRFDRALTRIEVRLKVGLSLNDLRSYPNPFQSLEIREIESLEVNGQRSMPHYWDWFVAATKQDGLEATLNRIKNPKTRRVWMDRVLQRTAPNWWQPNELWAGIRHAINEVGIFPAERHIRRTRIVVPHSP